MRVVSLLLVIAFAPGCLVMQWPDVELDAPILGGEPNVRLTPELPITTDSLTATVDFYGVDANDIALRWTLDGVAVADLDDVVSVPAERTQRGQVWQVHALAAPTEARPESVEASASITIENSAPRLQSVSAVRVFSSGSSQIEATPQVAADDDGDEVSFIYRWVVNDDVVQDGLDAVLVRALFAAGDVVQVHATPSDGLNLGQEVPGEAVSIENTAPTASGATATPELAFEVSVLRCDGVGFSDVEGDEEGWTYRWFVGGVDVASTQELTGELFGHGDVVYCEAAPDDGELRGVWARSTSITVQNTLPILGGVAVTPTAPTVEHTLSTVLGGTLDADGDAVTLTYAWMVNGAPSGTDSLLDAGDLKRGDSVLVRVTPTDGTDDGEPITSDAVTIVNAPPRVTRAIVSPASPKRSDPIECGAEGWDDPDDDAPKYEYAWSIAGVSSSEVSSRLSSGYARDQVVACTVTPYDGVDRGISVTSSVTVANTPPGSPGTPVLTPDAATSSDALKCTAPDAVVDADADTVTYRYQFDVDGYIIERASTTTSATLAASNTADGDGWTCRVRAEDGTDVSAWSADAGDVYVVDHRYVSLAGTFQGLGLFCGLDGDDDGLWCWGNNGSGERGIGTFTGTGEHFTEVSGGHAWDVMGAGRQHMCAIRGGALYCWGKNSSGAVGDGTTVSRSLPTPVSGSGKWAAVVGGYDATCGLKTDKSAWCWGSGSRGMLGNGDTSDKSVPTSVGGTWKQLEMGFTIACGVRTDDTLWCWGDGYLGNGRKEKKTLPVQVGTSKYKQVSVGVGVCAIRSDDTLWCWGENRQGFVGDGTTSTRSKPTQESTSKTWKVVSHHTHNTCAIRSDDTLWCWGWNNGGTVGDGTKTQRNSPVAVGKTHTWTHVVNQNDTSCALRSDGSMWCWGYRRTTSPTIKLR
ncbi:MAG: alpha-tubulin suppressor-like RCC1 family protein [Kiritimatiellia bacterium]|jgi:alpha-tubulin suppressor-like RCC1 family protein